MKAIALCIVLLVPALSYADEYQTQYRQVCENGVCRLEAVTVLVSSDAPKAKVAQTAEPPLAQVRPVGPIRTFLHKLFFHRPHLGYRLLVRVL